MNVRNWWEQNFSMRAIEDELLLKGFSLVLPHCAVGDWAAMYWFSQ